MPHLFSPVERLELIRDGFYSPDARQHTRAAALLALDRGLPVRAVARSVKCDRDTLYRWRAKYLENRDPAALRDGRGRSERRRTARLHPARAARLVARAATEGRDPDAPGRLGLESGARAELARLAAGPGGDRTRRYWAAVLWAYDRGVPITVIARAAGCCRRTVYQAPARHLAGVLDR